MLRPVSGPDEAGFELAEGELTERLSRDLEMAHQPIFAAHRWERQEAPDPHAEPPAELPGEPLAAYEIKPASFFVDDALCIPFDDRKTGRWVWYIREGEMSPRLAAELTRWVDHYVRTGLWKRPKKP